MPTRFVFAALCGLFLLLIAGAALWEWTRFSKRESALSPRHFRWRMLSALVWLVVLGSFAYASLFLWPQSRADEETARKFLTVSSGALLLMMFAFVLMAVDVFWTVQVGRKSALRRSQISQDTLQREIERVRRQTENSNGTG